MADILDKIPPHSTEAEMAVLGSMLIEKEAILKAIDKVNEYHFYSETHRRIFKAIKGLFLENSPVDMVSVVNELKKEGILEDVGGAAYITNLINTVSTAANIETYARIVHDKSILRQLIEAGTRIAQDGYRAEDKVENIVEKAEQMVFSIAQKRNGQGFTLAKDLVNPTLDRIEGLMTNKIRATGLLTGFKALDEMTSGFQPKNLIIIAARPSMGKTSFAANVIQNAAIRDNVPIAFFSLEMSKEELMFRMICTEAWVNSHSVRRGIVEKKSWPVITSVAEKVYNAPIYIDDTSSLSPLEIRTRARRLHSELVAEKKQLGMVVIDYIQLLKGSAHFESRQQEITDISRSLKELSKELSIPVIAVSQLSRKPEERGREGIPQLSDLRESGALEQDADVVIFIYRREVYSKSEDDKNKATIIVAKQRNGPTGDIEMNFFKEYTKFEPLDKTEK